MVNESLYMSGLAFNKTYLVKSWVVEELTDKYQGHQDHLALNSIGSNVAMGSLMNQVTGLPVTNHGVQSWLLPASNRRARQLLPLLNLIRRKLTQALKFGPHLNIIDSFPLPVCQPIRNHRVKIFAGYANLGYNATKKLDYNGFKAHCFATDNGYLLDYLITPASVHDAQAAPALIKNAHPASHYLLGDVGYLGQNLQETVRQMGYYLWTPLRKNMQHWREHNQRGLMQIRRTIESDFALLKDYNSENNRARSLTGFQECFELAILASNLAYYLAHLN